MKLFIAEKPVVAHDIAKLFTCTECDFKIWLEFCGKRLTSNQVEKLIKAGKKI